MRYLMLLILMAMLGPCPVRAEQGVTADSIHLVQIAALDGPAAALGKGMNLGLTAAFTAANAAGGVHGRQIVLTALDDGYEPGRAVAALRQVIADDDQLALIGSVGTAPARAMLPLTQSAGLPMIGPMTGAGFLRGQGAENVVNLRASYDAETAEWVRYLVETRGFSRIGILYQDDDFGRAGLAGVQKAMATRQMALVGQAAYLRNSVAVKEGMLDLRALDPEAVVIVGAYRPAAAFIAAAHAMAFRPVFVNISFVGSEALKQALGRDGRGVIISQVVPLPTDASLPVVSEYQAALAAVAPDAPADFVSLEGYLVGRMTVMALEAAGPSPTRSGLLTAFSGLGSVELGGLPLHFAAGDNQALDEVFLTAITSEGGFARISE